MQAGFLTLALAQEAAELLAELKFKGDVDGKRMKEFIVKGVQWECAAHHPHAHTHTHTRHATRYGARCWQSLSRPVFVFEPSCSLPPRMNAHTTLLRRPAPQEYQRRRHLLRRDCAAAHCAPGHGGVAAACP